MELGTNHVQSARECIAAAASASPELRILYVAAARAALTRAQGEVAATVLLVDAHEMELRRLASVGGTE